MRTFVQDRGERGAAPPEERQVRDVRLLGWGMVGNQTHVTIGESAPCAVPGNRDGQLTGNDDQAPHRPKLPASGRRSVLWAHSGARGGRVAGWAIRRKPAEDLGSIWIGPGLEKSTVTTNTLGAPPSEVNRVLVFVDGEPRASIDVTGNRGPPGGWQLYFKETIENSPWQKKFV